MSDTKTIESEEFNELMHAYRNADRRNVAATCQSVIAYVDAKLAIDVQKARDGALEEAAQAVALSTLEAPQDVDGYALGAFNYWLMLVDGQFTNASFEVFKAGYRAALQPQPVSAAQPIQPSTLAGWISVDDRLPEIGSPVIAYRPLAYLSNDPAYSITFRKGYENESPQGIRHEFECWSHPTLWMPLPALPAAPTKDKP
jgi:hypothetical protein